MKHYLCVTDHHKHDNGAELWGHIWQV